MPDGLSNSKCAVVVRAMGDSMTIGKGAGQVKLYAIRSVHVPGLLAAYVPSAQAVFTSDVVNLGAVGVALPVAGSRDLVDFGAGTSSRSGAMPVGMGASCRGSNCRGRLLGRRPFARNRDGPPGAAGHSSCAPPPCTSCRSEPQRAVRSIA